MDFALKGSRVAVGMMPMRSLGGFVCVFALGMVPLVGCEPDPDPDPNGGGGNGGSAGSGGMVGAGGLGGFGGVGGAPECERADDCEPGGACTVTVCAAGACDTQTAEDGTTCDHSAPGDGTCTGGTCGPTGCVPACVDLDEDDCTEPFCPPGATECSTRPAPEDSDCRENGNAGQCTLDGRCVQCNVADDCEPGGACTVTVCDAGVCDTQPAQDGTTCDHSAPGDGTCTGGTCGPTTCVPACVDLDEDDCTEPVCLATECSTQPVPEDSDCRANGVSGKCTLDGRCDLCADETCAAPSQCQEDSSCNEDTGACAPFENKDEDTPCTEGGGSYCDGHGTCVQCNVADDCEPGGECTVTVCAAGTCHTQTAEDDTTCDYSAPGNGKCTGGVCGPTTCVPACVDLDEDDCTEPFCPPGATECSTRPVNEHEDCNEGGGEHCDADGNCVECTLLEHCTDPEECTNDYCTVANMCVHEPKADGTPCSQGACLGGVCGTVFPCTEKGIRDAIAKGGGPYTFDCPPGGKTIHTSRQIEVNTGQGVSLIGDGITLNGGGTHRVFLVGDTALESLRLSGFVITNGNADLGGGIYNESGNVFLTDVQVLANHASGDGAGIYNRAYLNLNFCDVRQNTAEVWGGGIVNNGGVLYVSATTVVENQAKRSGGGLVHVGANFVPIDKSTFANNWATGDGSNVAAGGGIYHAGPGFVWVINSTVWGNGAEQGGAIWSSGPLTLVNATVADNVTLDVGSGDVHQSGAGVDTFVRGTLIDGDCAYVGNWMTATSLESPGDTCGLGPGHRVPDLQLGPIAPNGGPTWTLEPAITSPAVDFIPQAACTGVDGKLLETDQRGVSRPQGASMACDAGSVEVVQ